MISATYIALRWRGRGKRNMKRQPPSPDAPPPFFWEVGPVKKGEGPIFPHKKKGKEKEKERKREREKEKEKDR